MAQTYEIRGNSKMTQVDTDTISADQLARYLEAEVLGFPIKADFITTHGPNGGCYVVMDITIADEYIASQPSSGNYVEKFLAKNSSAIQFKADIVKALKPFMFPTDWTKVLADPVSLNQLNQKGIMGSALAHIRQFADFRKSERYNEWAIALDTEKLLRHYYSNPTSGEIEGRFTISHVTGERAPGITWDIAIVRDGSRTSNDGVTVDAIFRSIR